MHEAPIRKSGLQVEAQFDPRIVRLRHVDRVCDGELDQVRNAEREVGIGDCCETICPMQHARVIRRGRVR